jgi:hypothetical protein
MTRRILATLILLSPLFFVPTSIAAVTSTPTINLDASLPSSLGTNAPTRWNDLATGSLQFVIGSNSTYSSFGGGSLTNTSAGTSGAYLAPPQSSGSASNPSGDISVMTWVYFTSWNVDWNILSSRWFSDTAGAGGTSDFHFAVRKKGSNYRLNLFTTSTADIDGSTNIALNKWYLLGFTLGGGVPKFYINGQYDTPTVTSGVTRAAHTNAYLFVGDYRTACTACSFNGYMSKFRMWNTVLNSTTLLADYRNEAASLGYGTTTSLALSSNSLKYRTSNPITATVSLPGRVTFYEKGKLIPKCKNVVVATTTGSCAWKPTTHGVTSISATFQPTDRDYISSTSTQNLVVSKRTTPR